MSRAFLRWLGLTSASAIVAGCLVNSVHPIRTPPRSEPDKTHAVVVIGVGVDETWPHSEFQITLPEYSPEKQGITGNCFHYNRIEMTHPPSPSSVSYRAFEVPSNAYVFLEDHADAHLVESPIGRAFIAPPGGTVYFGDYVFAGDNVVQFRRDLDAARAATIKFIPKGSVLKLAEPTPAPNVHIFLCTP